MKKFHTLVFVGRFSPLHLGHEAVIKTALENANEVIVVVGSSFTARTERNPFTFDERRAMIKAAFPQSNVKVVPVCDYPNDDDKWVTAVRSLVSGAQAYSPDPMRIGLIGHSKDSTSYYLKIFAPWDSIEVGNVDGLNATDIRKELLGNPTRKPINAVRWSKSILHSMSNEAYVEMKSIIENSAEVWETLWVEYQSNSDYKKPYKKLSRSDLQEWLDVHPNMNALDLLENFSEEFRPKFPPIYSTVDAVVVQSGHVLLVKRKHSPGKGLWALPGGFLDQTERTVDGAIRELKEETGIKVPTDVLHGSIDDYKVFDNPNRSIRGRTITHAYLIRLKNDIKLPKVRGSDDAEKAVWMPLDDVVKYRDQFFDDHFHLISFFLKIG